ncbi:MAG: hypothetical protein ACK4RW_08415, partial [Rehaibacterium terrae]|uniref:hypothetical protein n=1 Tax=Rehaibacterium terrae TaxID=1341696 RepID=UPI00391AE51F
MTEFDHAGLLSGCVIGENEEPAWCRTERTADKRPDPRVCAAVAGRCLHHRPDAAPPETPTPP